MSEELQGIQYAQSNGIGLGRLKDGPGEVRKSQGIKDLEHFFMGNR